MNRKVMEDRVGNKGGFHPYRYAARSPALWDTFVLQSGGWHPPLCGVEPKICKSLRINHCPPFPCSMALNSERWNGMSLS